MANPTLISQRTPHPGFTFTQAQEELLQVNGLTLDSTTGRMVASADETARAKRCVNEALDELNQKWPNTFGIVTKTGTWVANDHSVALPSDCGQPIAVRFNGLPVHPLSRDDIERMRRSDDQGGGLVISDAGDAALAYKVTGFSDEDALTTDGHVDYRMVLRLYPTPTTGDAYEVDYISLAPLLANGADTLPLWPALQRWVVNRAREMWADRWNDSQGLVTAERARQKSQDAIEMWIEGSREQPQRVTTRMPNQNVKRRSRFRS